MLDIFLFSVNAIMPIIMLVVLGYFIKRIGFGSPDFYKTANSLVFKVFLPVMLFYNVYEIKSLRTINWALVAFFVVAILVITIVGFLTAKIVTHDRKKLPVIAQCAYRSNHAVIGLPLAESIGGEAAISFAAVISAVAIPLFNVLAVVILSAYSDDEKKGKLKKTIIQTVTNPLIIGCGLGMLALFIRHFIPINDEGVRVFTLEKSVPFLMDIVKSISRMCSPFALIVLGARTDFSAVRSLFKYISVGVILRLVVAPLIGIGGAYLVSKTTGLFPVEADEYPGLIALFGSPVATASAVMVNEIGGDDQLAIQFVVWTSVLSIFTIFLTVFTLKSFALI